MSFSLSRLHRTIHAKSERVKGSGHGSNAFPVTNAVEKMFVTEHRLQSGRSHRGVIRILEARADVVSLKSYVSEAVMPTVIGRASCGSLYPFCIRLETRFDLRADLGA